MTEFTRPKRKKPNRLRVILLVALMFLVLYLLKNTDSLVSQFFGK